MNRSASGDLTQVRLAEILERLARIEERVVNIEHDVDALDRFNRPYGDGTRMDFPRRRPRR